MKGYLFDQKNAKKDLSKFFKKQKAKLSSFGNAVNQTFEAYVFAKVIEWYQNKGYDIKIMNPKINGISTFRLKFSTRGAPKNYSYALISLNGNTIQLRHQLRISTKSYRRSQKNNANICCDISIIKDIDLTNYTTDDAINNSELISFGEVKHMSAFAELVASFIGLVHELTPQKLKRIRVNTYTNTDISPFLYVSGLMNPTAKGIVQSIQHRKFDIDIYSFDNPMN